MPSRVPDHPRRSVRLPGYDYATPGAYFVTIVTQGRLYLFGSVVDDNMRLSASGHVALAGWQSLPDHFDGLVLDEVVVMPNHIHGVLWLGQATDQPATCVAEPRGAPGGGWAQHAAPLHEAARTRDGAHSQPLPEAGRTRDGARSQPMPEAARTRDGAHSRMAPSLAAGSLGVVVRSYKAAVTRELRAAALVAEGAVWQRGYYEHVVRGEGSLDRIRRYISGNPSRWATDDENPDRQRD